MIGRDDGLPTWEEARDAMENECATAAQKFIYSFEPRTLCTLMFREELGAVLAEAREQEAAPLRAEIERKDYWIRVAKLQVEERIAELTQARTEIARLKEEPYQQRVHSWMLACFNDEIAFSVRERNHRFLEEALELVQAEGCTPSEAHQLVDYVFGRAVGELTQEVGGVLVCLAALCTAHGIDMAAAGETELARVWTKVEQIRAKHAAKPKHSPLPGTTPPDATEGGGA